MSSLTRSNWKTNGPWALILLLRNLVKAQLGRCADRLVNNIKTRFDPKGETPKESWVQSYLNLYPITSPLDVGLISHFFTLPNSWTCILIGLWFSLRLKWLPYNLVLYSINIPEPGLLHGCFLLFLTTPKVLNIRWYDSYIGWYIDFGPIPIRYN